MAVASCSPPPQRCAWSAVVFVVLVALAALAPVLPADAAGGVGDTEAAIAQRLAAERERAGLSSLRRSSQLDAVARDWARRSAAADQMRHNPDLRSQVQPARAWYENVGTILGVPSALTHRQAGDRLHEMWMGSAGHRANIVRDPLTDVGIGVAATGDRIYATVVFRRQDGAAAEPPPEPDPVEEPREPAPEPAAPSSPSPPSGNDAAGDDRGTAADDRAGGEPSGDTGAGRSDDSGTPSDAIDEDERDAMEAADRPEDRFGGPGAIAHGIDRRSGADRVMVHGGRASAGSALARSSDATSDDDARTLSSPFTRAGSERLDDTEVAPLVLTSAAHAGAPPPAAGFGPAQLAWAGVLFGSVIAFGSLRTTRPTRRRARPFAGGG